MGGFLETSLVRSGRWVSALRIPLGSSLVNSTMLRIRHGRGPAAGLLLAYASAI